MERGCLSLEADIVMFKIKSLGEGGAGGKTQTTKPNPSQDKRVSYNTVSKK